MGHTAVCSEGAEQGGGEEGAGRGRDTGGMQVGDELVSIGLTGKRRDDLAGGMKDKRACVGDSPAFATHRTATADCFVCWG